MRRHKHIMNILLTSLILTTVVGTAAANTLSTSSRSLRMTWAGLTFAGGGLSVTCPATLEGTLHTATFTKTRGALIGTITRARAGRPCTGGTGWIYNGTESNEVLGGTLSNTLPWHVTYEEFGGTLPVLTEINLLLAGLRYLFRTIDLSFTVLCNYTSNIEHPSELTSRFGRGGTITNSNFNELRKIPSESGGLCPETALSGEGSVRNGSGENVRITLI